MTDAVFTRCAVLSQLQYSSPFRPLFKIFILKCVCISVCTIVQLSPEARDRRVPGTEVKTPGPGNYSTLLKEYLILLTTKPSLQSL